MSENSKITIKDPEILFLSFLGTGFSPYAPGTAGSLAILIPLFLLGQMNPPFFFFIPFIIVLTAASVYITHIVEKRHGLHDPQWIVIDEVVGMWIATLFLQSTSLTHFIVAFILFRAFDILKPWPVNYFDNLQSAFGTIFDDVVAGIMAGCTYLLTFKLLEILS